jgi:hypothetical protein
MDLSRRTREWEVLGVAGVGGGAVIAGGEFLFHFRSPHGTAQFSLSVYGLGAGGMGGSVGGTYSRIEPECAFSVNDLDGCMGRFTTAGAGWGAAYALVYISAFGWSVGNLFLSQSVGGLTISAGAGAMTGAGYWKYIQTV